MAPRVAMVTSRHIATISCSHAVIFSSSSSSVPVCLSLALTSPLTRQRFDMGHVCELSFKPNQMDFFFGGRVVSFLGYIRARSGFELSEILVGFSP